MTDEKEIQTDENPRPAKYLIIHEDGGMEWGNFDDEYQQLGFIQLRLNSQAIQRVATQIAQEHARRQTEARKAKGAQKP